MNFQDFPVEGTPPFINRKLTIAEWDSYVDRYDFGRLAPSTIVLHNTYKPNEADWAGLASMRAMQRFYAGKGWTAAPHIYTAPDGIWLATPMSEIGIHAGSGNGSLKQGWYSIGLEMVGSFDKTKPQGRVWEYTLAVLRGLARKLQRTPEQLLRFHRDYTDEKSCPGWAVNKTWVLQQWKGGDMTWVDKWQRVGVILPKEQYGWAVPTLYQKHADALGACVIPEQWPLPGVRSITHFEKGLIRYVKATNSALVVLDSAT